MTEFSTLRELAQVFGISYDRVRLECLTLEPEYIDGRIRYFDKSKVKGRLYKAMTRTISTLLTSWVIGREEVLEIARSIGAAPDKNDRIDLADYQHIEAILKEANHEHRREHTQIPKEKLFSTKEVADKLGTDRSYVLNLLKKNNLPLVQTTGRRGHTMVPEESVNALLAIRAKEMRGIVNLANIYEVGVKELREICKSAEIVISDDSKVSFADYKIIVAILGHDEVPKRRQKSV